MIDTVMDCYASLRSIENELKILDLVEKYEYTDEQQALDLLHEFGLTYAKYLLLREATKLMDKLNDLGYEVETVNGDLTTMVMIHKKGMSNHEG